MTASKLNMRNTTLCYLEQNGAYLMLHRVKKENDLNHDKWVGIGGKFEEGESPEDCLLRETGEETGLTLDAWRYCGIVTFVMPMQRSNARSPIIVTLDGIVTLVMPDW